MLDREKLKILIVEDNPGDFLLIQDYLLDEMPNPVISNVKTFNDASEVLKSSSDFDAILLDLTLPDNAGKKLVNDMVQLVSDTPIIVLTGYLDKEFGIKTLSMGITDYLLKDDLSPSHLVKSISYSIERKRISTQSKESEEKYRSMFDFSPIPMWIFDVETYEFLNVNEAAVRQYGYSKSEFLSMTIMDIRPPEDIEQIKQIVKNNKKTGVYSWGNYRHLKKGGELMHVAVKSNLIEFEGRKARLALVIDITDQVKYTQAIEEQNQRLREIAWSQSHVVRAPLARMMGLIDILSKNHERSKEPDEILNHLMHSARELDVIIRDIVRKTEVINNEDENEAKDSHS